MEGRSGDQLGGASLGRLLSARGDEIADALVDRYYAENPEIIERYGAAGRTKCRRDAQYHIAYLAEAALNDQPVVWSTYVDWARIMLSARRVPIHDLTRNLDCLQRVLVEKLPPAESAYALQMMRTSPAPIAGDADAGPPSFIEPHQPLAQLATVFLDELLAGNRRDASRMILEAVDAGVPIRDIYLFVFQRCQQELGRRWQLNLISVAQEHFCSAATQLIMSQLYSRIFSAQRAGRTMVAASIGGDLHEIGVRMISDFFEMDGWDTFYLGANTPVDTILATVRTRRPDIVAISVTMPYHVSEAARLITLIRDAALDPAPHILVGGRAFATADGLWKDIGADATAQDAALAVTIATRLVEGAR